MRRNSSSSTSVTFPKKPQVNKGIIPPKQLGDILQIWNFFYNYSDLFKFEDIEKEEIYAALVYKGPKSCFLIQDMHQGLASLFLKEIKAKNRFESQKDEADYPFLVVAKYYVTEDLNGDEMTSIWTEFVRNLFRTPQAAAILTDTSRKSIEALAQHTAMDYNFLDYNTKVRVLLDLIELFYDTEVFRDFMEKRMDEVAQLTKERKELLDGIKRDEAELRESKSKTKELEEKLAKEEEKELEKERKEYERSVSIISEAEASVQKKKAKLHKITKDLANPVQTATLIGLDSNKSEYWLFYCEPTRIYVKYTTTNLNGEETWFYYDKQEELELLQGSLNQNNAREKSLLENLQNLVKNKIIEFEPTRTGYTKEFIHRICIHNIFGQSANRDAENDQSIRSDDKIKDIFIEKDGEIEEDNRMKEEMPRQTRNNKTISTSTGIKIQKETLDFWHAKVLEYEIMTKEPDSTRTSRQRAKQSLKTENKNEFSYTDYKNFSLEMIKDRIKQTEKAFSEYLYLWGSRWAKPAVKEEIMTLLDNADKAPEMAYILLRLNEEWQKCETLVKRIRPDMTREEDENEEEGIGNDVSTNYNSNSEKGDETVDEKRGSKEKANEKNINSKNKKTDHLDLKRTGPKKVETKKERQNREEEKAKKDLNFEALDQSIYRIQRIYLKLWSNTEEKLSRCWIPMTKNADNFAAIYFSMVIFCETVINYCVSRTKRHFVNGERRQKRSRNQPTTSTIITKSETKDKFQLNLDDIEQFRFTRAQARALREEGTNKVKVRRKDKHLAPTRSPRASKMKESTDFKFLSQSERNFVKRDKLNQLVSARESKVRRSKRNVSKRRVNLVEEDEEEEDDSEKSESQGYVECQQCSVRYRLEDIGLESQPDEDWQCFDCEEKAEHRRKTRSSSRRIRY